MKSLKKGAYKNCAPKSSGKKRDMTKVLDYCSPHNNACTVDKCFELKLKLIFMYEAAYGEQYVLTMEITKKKKERINKLYKRQ